MISGGCRTQSPEREDDAQGGGPESGEFSVPGYIVENECTRALEIHTMCNRGKLGGSVVGFFPKTAPGRGDGKCSHPCLFGTTTMAGTRPRRPPYIFTRIPNTNKCTITPCTFSMYLGA